MRHLVTSAENCDLMEIPGVMFGMRSYGLAVPHHNATWKSRLDLLILELIETGDIEALEDKSVLCCPCVSLSVCLSCFYVCLFASMYSCHLLYCLFKYHMFHLHFRKQVVH